VRYPVFAALVFFSLATIGHARADDRANCDLHRIAELEMKVDTASLRVKVLINGRDVWLTVDPASPISMISRRLVDDLKLPVHEPAFTIISGRGKHFDKVAVAKSFTLAGLTAEDVDLVVIDGLTSKDGVENRYEGSIGAEFLSAYDVELDLPHGRMALFSKDHCKGQVVYWTPHYVAIPFELDRNFHINFPVILDGHRLKAILNTSCGFSKMDIETLKSQFNTDPATQPTNFIAKSGDVPEDTYYIHRFDTFDIGGITFRNTEFDVTQGEARSVRHDYPDLPLTHVTVGLHQLAQLRLYIAYGEHVIYASAGNATK